MALTLPVFEDSIKHALPQHWVVAAQEIDDGSIRGVIYPTELFGTIVIYKEGRERIDAGAVLIKEMRDLFKEVADRLERDYQAFKKRADGS